MTSQNGTDDRYIGLSNAEAFSQLSQDVKELLQYIHKQRGETTDEDLIEKVTWRIEALVGLVDDNRT